MARGVFAPRRLPRRLLLKVETERSPVRRRLWARGPSVHQHRLASRKLRVDPQFARRPVRPSQQRSQIASIRHKVDRRPVQGRHRRGVRHEVDSFEQLEEGAFGEA